MRHTDRLHRAAVRFMVVLVAISLHFANQVAALAHREYRLFFQPERDYRLALVLDVLLLAALAMGLDALLGAIRLARLRYAYRYLFPVVLGSGLISVLPWVRERPRVVLVLWGVLMGALLVAFLRRSVRPLRIAADCGLILSPLSVVLALYLFSWNAPVAASKTTARPPSRPPARNAPPVFIFLFDEWSYPRSVHDGAILPCFANFRRLAAHSFSFRAAHSESLGTERSVPKLLFQTARTIRYDSGHPCFVVDGRRIASSQFPSLFRVAQERGYFTSAIGWFLPYRLIFDDQLDSCQTTPCWPRPLGGLPGSMVRALAANLPCSHDPVARLLRRAVVIRELVWTDAKIRAQALRLIASCPRNTFAFIHWSLPHSPFIFHPDRPPNRFLVGRTPEDYREQMAYADIELGRMLDALEAAGLYDDALVLFLSDHGLRQEHDPKILATPHALYRVPVALKWPGQREAVSIDQPFSTTQLGALITLALDGATAEDARRAIERMPRPDDPKDDRPDDPSARLFEAPGT